MNPGRKRLGAAFVLGAAAALAAVGVCWALIVGPRPAVGEMPAAVVERLRALGQQALASQDVPVGAVVTYRGEIIGEGYNTVLRDHDAGGHAEIRALSDVIAKRGLEGLAALDKDEVVLYSSFEPCVMCRGALELYGVRHVEYLGAKDLRHLLGEELRLFTLLLTRRAREPSGLQEELFLMHPHYPRRPAATPAP